VIDYSVRWFHVSCAPDLLFSLDEFSGVGQIILVD